MSRTLTTTIATETVTVTTTVTGIALKARDLAPRATTVTPTAAPTYLFGPCTQPSAYGSACSCLGIPRTTTTAPAPTSFVSVTETTTITTTVTVAPPGECAAGGSCSTYLNIPCDAYVACRCATDADGEGFCWGVQTQCATDPGMLCNANADCGEGERCVVGPCCDGERFCVAVAPPGSCILT
ncbi:hypothetical protein BJY00DRAFT_312373 [Aspergillus carlsbadensis]|nr:hypothetical protein BJY00DRAFT_312373 [Aspergillus carlsbadensis]